MGKIHMVMLTASCKHLLHQSLRHWILVPMRSLQMQAKVDMIPRGHHQPQREDPTVMEHHSMDIIKMPRESHCMRAALFTVPETNPRTIASPTVMRKAPTTMATRNTHPSQLRTGTTLPTRMHMQLIIDLVTCSRALSRTTTFLNPEFYRPMRNLLYLSTIHEFIQVHRRRTSVRRRAKLQRGLPRPHSHHRWP